MTDLLASPKLIECHFGNLNIPMEIVAEQRTLPTTNSILPGDSQTPSSVRGNENESDQFVFRRRKIVTYFQHRIRFPIAALRSLILAEQIATCDVQTRHHPHPDVLLFNHTTPADPFFRLGAKCCKSLCAPCFAYENGRPAELWPKACVSVTSHALAPKPTSCSPRRRTPRRCLPLPFRRDLESRLRPRNGRSPIGGDRETVVTGHLRPDGRRIRYDTQQQTRVRGIAEPCKHLATHHQWVGVDAYLA